jgi:histidinol phosphatase-like enzyme (inositol monophosphatase family)
MTDLAELTAFLDVLADAAAHAIMPHFRAPLSVENKLSAGFDPVTVADRAGEAAMRTLINARYPAHGIVGEEYGKENADAEYVWVLDPIDGTRAFITGVPVWGILIGLTRRGRPILGMMHQPFSGERFWGNGKQAWFARGGSSNALKTRACAEIGKASLFTTSPRLFNRDDRVAYDRVEDSVRLARYGCDCYAYCMIAAGQADIGIETDLQPYDIVALIPIVEGAGGRVTDWSGNSVAAGGRAAATGDPRLHEQVLRLLSA